MQLKLYRIAPWVVPPLLLVAVLAVLHAGSRSLSRPLPVPRPSVAPAAVARIPAASAKPLFQYELTFPPAPLASPLPPLPQLAGRPLEPTPAIPAESSNSNEPDAFVGWAAAVRTGWAAVDRERRATHWLTPFESVLSGLVANRDGVTLYVPDPTVGKRLWVPRTETHSIGGGIRYRWSF